MRGTLCRAFIEAPYHGGNRAVDDMRALVSMAQGVFVVCCTSERQELSALKIMARAGAFDPTNRLDYGTYWAGTEQEPCGYHVTPCPLSYGLGGQGGSCRQGS